MQRLGLRLVRMFGVFAVILTLTSASTSVAQAASDLTTVTMSPWHRPIAAWFTGLTRDVAKPQRLYAVGHLGGGRSWQSNPERNFFVSDDVGLTWSEAFIGGGRAGRMHDIVMSDDGTLFASSSGGVLRSRNEGQSWEWLDDVARQPNYQMGTDLHLATHHTEPATIFAWTAYWLAVSRDAGDSWVKLGPVLQRCGGGAWELIADPAIPSRVYASGCGIARSDDDGASWREIDTPPEMGPIVSAQRLVWHPHESSVLLAILRDNRERTTGDGRRDAPQHVLWRTTDAGETWKRLQPSDGRVDDLLFDPRDVSGNSLFVRVYGAENGLLVSRDLGDTWERFEPSPAPQAGACWNTADSWMMFVDDHLWMGSCGGAWRRALPALIP